MIANEGHIPAFLEMGDRIQLKAVCGRNVCTVSETANRFGIPFCYTQAEEMLEAVQPEVVAICTPNQSHAGYAALALEAGCHVICEKPLGLDSRQVKKLYELAEKNDRYLVACQSLRFQPEWIQAKKLIREGTLGEIVSVRFDRIRSRGIPTWGGFHRKTDSGGGAMADIGVHMLDGLLWMLGNPKVISVAGFASDKLVKSTAGLLCAPELSSAADGEVSCGGYDSAEFDVEEYAAGIARLENGIPLSFQAAWAANLPERTSIQILGTKASLTLPQMRMHDGKTAWTQAIDGDIRRTFSRYEGAFTGHKYLLEHMLDVLDGSAQLQITPDETINVCCALDLFYRSVSRRRETFITEL